MPYNLWSNMTTPDPAAKWADKKMEEIGLREPDQPGPITRPIVKPQTFIETPVQTPTNTVNTTTRPVVNPQSPSSGMDYISSLWTSPQEEAERRKASVNRQRVMAVADALRHIGNIYNTVKGSPSQKFTNPVGDEEKRYLTEKAIRDQNNMKVISYQQAKAAQDAKARQWEADYNYKVANAAAKAEEARRRNDAYIESQKANKGLIEARTKNEVLRGEGIGYKNQYDKVKAENAPLEFDLKNRNTESMIASRKDASARGWANYNLSVSKENRLRNGNSYQGSSKDRNLYSSPDGSSYSFPKGVINSQNINAIYGDMKRKGLIKGFGASSDGEKWDQIMQAAGTSKVGHDAFVYHAKRLGYRYEGGMRQEIQNSYWGGNKTPKKPSASKGTSGKGKSTTTPTKLGNLDLR